MPRDAARARQLHGHIAKRDDRRVLGPAQHKEALANVEIVIQEWMERAEELGRPISAPRGCRAFVAEGADGSTD